MMKYVYPAVFTEEKDGRYSVGFPDFDDTRHAVVTCGDSLVEAMFMAEDVLCIALYETEQDNVRPPKASGIRDIKTCKGSFASYVYCDTKKYEDWDAQQSVKKTLTIPKWMDRRAKKLGVNFSAILQEALEEKLSSL
jgi:predicted RNase H-like HicB family nuclease